MDKDEARPAQPATQREAAASFLAWTRHAPHGYALTDAAGLVVDCNASWHSLLGRSRGECVGKAVETLIWTLEDGLDVDTVIRRLAGDAVHATELDVRPVPPGDPERALGASVNVVDAPGGPLYLWQISDSARLAKAQARAGQFEQVFEQCGAAINVKDLDGVVTFWNREAEALYGFTAQEAVGQPLRKLHAAVLTEQAYAKVMARIRSGKPSASTSERRKKNGEQVQVAITTAPLVDERGRLTGEITVARDVTAIHLAMANLAAAQQKLLQADKLASVGQLAAGVAHEINNPIGYVYSNLGTLDKYLEGLLAMLDCYAQAEPALPRGAPELQRIRETKQRVDLEFLREDLVSLMAESREGITRVKKIVQDLKDFSHADTPDDWTMADLAKGLESTLNIVHNELKYKCTVVRELEPLPPVECLQSQINQVLMNLLVNASHAIADQGTVTVRAGVSGDEVWISVSDTGCGIPAENLKRIFDPFFTTKPVGKGTGLGLSLAYGIIEKHHGRIEVTSEPGSGTTFRVALPVRQSRAAAALAA